MIFSRISLRALVVAFVASLLMFGCSRQNPVAPIPTGDSYAVSQALDAGPLGQGAFFPLAIGNRWHAVADDHMVTTPAGGGPPIDETNIHTDITRELTGTEELSGRTYTLLREDGVETLSGDPNGDTYTDWIRYRQDGDGLYESDVTGPPAAGIAPAAASPRPTPALPASIRDRVPAAQLAAYERAWEKLQRKIDALRTAVANPQRTADVASGEITRLAYPLRPGAAWVIRDDPNFTSTVEGSENLDIPAGRFRAYRIRIDSEFFGPNDLVHLWMSRSGQLRFQYHLEGTATDENGDVIGTFVGDRDEVVDEISLVK